MAIFTGMCASAHSDENIVVVFFTVYYRRKVKVFCEWDLCSVLSWFSTIPLCGCISGISNSSNALFLEKHFFFWKAECSFFFIERRQCLCQYMTQADFNEPVSYLLDQLVTTHDARSKISRFYFLSGFVRSRHRHICNRRPSTWPSAHPLWLQLTVHTRP